MNPAFGVTESCPLASHPHSLWLAHGNLTTSVCEYSNGDGERWTWFFFYVTWQLLLCRQQTEGAVPVYCCSCSWDDSDWRRWWTFFTAQRNVMLTLSFYLGHSEKCIQYSRHFIDKSCYGRTLRHYFDYYWLCSLASLLSQLVHCNLFVLYLNGALLIKWIGSLPLR